jgi:hypothetical protein
MMTVPKGITLVGILISLAMVFWLTARSPRAQLSAELQAALNQQALSLLKWDADILMAKPFVSASLIPRYSGMTRTAFTGEEYLRRLTEKAEALESDRPVKIDVTLRPLRIELRDGTVVLYAREHTIEYFLDRSPSQEAGEHEFIFAVSPATGESQGSYTVQLDGFRYTLIRDVSEPQMLKEDASTIDDSQAPAKEPVKAPLVAPKKNT